MSVTTTEQEVLHFVRKLPPNLQRRVRDFAEALVMTQPRKGGSPSGKRAAHRRDVPRVRARVQQRGPLRLVRLVDGGDNHRLMPRQNRRGAAAWGRRLGELRQTGMCRSVSARGEAAMLA